MRELSREFVDTSNRRSFDQFLGRPMKEVLEFGQDKPTQANQFSVTNQDVDRPVEQDTPRYDPNNWRAFAQCIGQTSLFFPTNAERPHETLRREARARELCRQCPAILECRKDAIRKGEYGIWGDTTEEERRQLGF